MCGAGGCCGGAVVRWCRCGPGLDVPLVGESHGRRARARGRGRGRKRQTKRPPGYAQSSHSLPPIILLSTLLLLSLPYNHASPRIESQHTSHITSLRSLLSAPWPSACLLPPPLLTPYILPPSCHPRKAAPPLHASPSPRRSLRGFHLGGSSVSLFTTTSPLLARPTSTTPLITIPLPAALPPRSCLIHRPSA
jgi:hypothetical protein